MKNDVFSDPSVKDLLDKVVVVDLSFRRLKWIPSDENLEGFIPHWEELEGLEPDDKDYNYHLDCLKDYDPHFEENKSYYCNYGAVCVERTFESGDFESAVSVSDGILDEGFPELSFYLTDWMDDYDTDEIKVYISTVFRSYGSHREYDLFSQIGWALSEQYGVEGNDFSCDPIGKPIVFRSTYEDTGNVNYFAIDEDGCFCLDDYEWCERAQAFFEKLDEAAPKTVTIGGYTITVGAQSVSVCQTCKNAMQALRDIAASVGMEVSSSWNNRTLANKLLEKYCGKGKKQGTIGEYTIVRHEDKHIEVLHICSDTEAALRDVAALIGFSLDANSTLQLSAQKMVEYIEANKDTITLVSR